MKKTKRDIHKEIMYNKIMPTGHMKRSGFEEYVDVNDDNNISSISFPEKADINPEEFKPKTPAESASERKARMAAEEDRAAQKIDSENENIVKILSEKEKTIHQPPEPPKPAENIQPAPNAVNEKKPELKKPAENIQPETPEPPQPVQIVKNYDAEVITENTPLAENVPFDKAIRDETAVSDNSTVSDSKKEFSVDDILNEIPENKPSVKSAPKVQLPELININEVMINNKIDEILDKFNCCKCPDCKLEVIATALNKLSPQYVIKRNEHTVPDAIAESSYAKINSALINAIITLRANPVHK
ncbi:MAG: late competence development ComFB family protein [Oscillospiraceae bacterium]